MIEHAERRADTEFNVRSKILAAIDATDDKNQRNVLLLMFGVLEAHENGMRRIELKIDAVLRDEATIKHMAFNGHEKNHHSHHDWVEDRMSAGCEQHCDWVAQKKAEEEAMKPVCEWAKVKMAEEAESKRAKKTIIQKFFEGISGNTGALIAAGAIGWLLAQWGK